MSYARLTEKEKILAEEVSAMLADAQRVDHAEDAKYGKDGRGDELPEDLRRKESRLATMRQAKTDLEAEARERAEAAAEAKARAAGADESQVAERVAAAGQAAVPAAKAQRKFTDPESRIMKTADGSFHQCYNAQTVVDADHQVIVATDLTDVGNDVAALVPVVSETMANTGTAPGQVLADAGYTSAACARRKAIVEPVFGQIATLQGKHVLLGGLDSARAEWLLIAACHNLRKLHHHLGTPGSAAMTGR